MKSLEDIKTDISIRWYGFKWNVRNKWNSSVKWCEENKELALGIGVPVFLATTKGIGNAIRSIDRKRDLKREQELQDLYIFDHSLGMYHKLRRPLRPSEKIEIDRRRKMGESKIQILASMGLLE